ncbi:MAG: hypothetical protein RL367_179, partial [Pseudomonadota bacterium]
MGLSPIHLILLLLIFGVPVLVVLVLVLRRPAGRGHLIMPPPAPPSGDLATRARQLLGQGNKIMAIKIVREETGMG